MAERLARALLESSTRPIEDIVTACGFGTTATLRHHFRAALGTSLTAYRTRFAAPT